MHLEKLAREVIHVDACDFVVRLEYSDFDGEKSAAEALHLHLKQGRMVLLKGYPFHRGIELTEKDLVNILHLEMSDIAPVHGLFFFFRFQLF